jgi:glucose/arabinose dehydrogenase
MRLLMKAALTGAACIAVWAAPAAAQEPRYEVTTLAEGLRAPWGLAILPGGSMLVTEKASGTVRLVRNGALVEEPITGVPEDIFHGGQGGLLDIALHPQFATNRLVYLSYSWGDASANATRVARARLDGSALTNLEVIFTADPLKNTAIHFGGRIAFLPDNTFVLTIGDGFVMREDAQRLGSLLGKTVRLNDDGSIPADNPFVGQEGARGEIWTLGHRNEQGLVVDSVTGRLWETEHGPWGGDELNLLERGNNYGWPVITWGKDYNGARISPFREYPGMEQPRVNWTPVIAASGLAVYHGSLFREWDGDILAGGLQAGTIVRVETDAAGAAMEAERLQLFDTPTRVRDVRVGPDGAIYVLTDHPDNGRLLRIAPAGAGPA